MALTQVKTSGLADDAVTGAKIADDTVAEANMANDAIGLAEIKAGTDGQILTFDASGNPSFVGPGTDGQVLTSTGAGSPPAFEAIPAAGAALSNDANNRVVTADGSGGINGEAGLTCDGTHLSITDGNLVIATAGHGIDFSAVGAGSSVTASENILDDYECGTWTPSVVTGTLGSGTEGYYVKVGNVVHVNGRLETWSNTTSGQPIIMNVRPFAASRCVQVPMACHLLFFGSSNGTAYSFHFHNNNNWYVIYQGNNAGQSYFQHSDIQDAGCSITFQGSYIIA